jgi:quercetin dioxygenase-like cupin family protein
MVMMMETVDMKEGDVMNEARIVRYADLKPCYDAFIDTRTPGSDKKENFTIIGPGVSENPNQFVHIAEPHGFNIGGARQPPKCVNSQHSHDTAEVFFVHSGTWSFNLGETGMDAKITLKEGDLISIPTQVFRGFENIGEDVGYLWAILGKDDPGKVLWAPDVFDMAKDYGLVLLENGMLVDTAKGEALPEDAQIMPVTTQEQINRLQVFDDGQLRDCCILADESVPMEVSLTAVKRHLIGPETKLSWDHEFTLDHVSLEAGQTISTHNLETADVIFVHRGELTLSSGEGVWVLQPGDTVTIPRGVDRCFENVGDVPVEYLRLIGDQ